MRPSALGLLTYFYQAPITRSVAVVDLDGTICNTKLRERLIPNWSAYSLACDSDEPIPAGLAVVHGLSEVYDVVLLTGRQDIAWPQTRDWLDCHHVQYVGCGMRPDGDHRPNPIVKRVFVETLMSTTKIALVFDDHPGVILQMRLIGVPTIHAQFDATTTQAVQALDFDSWKRNPL